MQIYKKRDFGALMSDSFLFFKQNGKNYFKNYLVINGGLLLLLMLIIAVGFGDIISQLYQSNMGDKSFLFEQYFTENFGVYITVCILIFVFAIFMALMNYAFPIVYLDMLGNQKRNDFTVGEITEALKAKLGKILIFFLFSLFLLLPITLVLLGIGFAFIYVLKSLFLVFLFLILFLIFLIIGVPVLSNLYNFNLFDYLVTKNGVFKAFSNALKIQFSKNFWKYMGTTLAMYILIQTVVSVFSIIPMIVTGIGGTYTKENPDGIFVIIITYIITYAISILVSLILSNALYICAGLMYYDARTDLHRQEYYSEIDEIGKKL